MNLGFGTTASMRYRKGSKVEVSDRREMPLGPWRCAEIISGNGHTYNVRYNCYSPDIGVTVERVPRKAIRPCPPPVRCPKSWAAGDIVEVFEDNSWKLVRVSRDVGGDYYFVRLLGSFGECRAHSSCLRVPQTWQGNRWVVIRKDDEIIDNWSKIGKCILKMPQSCLEVKKCTGYNRSPDVIGEDLEEHYRVSSRGMKKRVHVFSPLVETCHGVRRKIRAVEKEGMQQRLLTGRPSFLLNKVDAFASPHTMLGEKCMHSSLNHETTGFCELDMDWKKLNAESNDAESPCSSVGSCSASNSPHMLVCHPIISPAPDSDAYIDEAESSSESDRELTLSMTKGLDEDIHRLELYAYRSTMLAFHASGPLTWEKEALLTNLRLMLHISNDEHLLELKHLAST